MEDFKPLLTSKTFWGCVVAIGATAVHAIWHHTVPLDDQQAAVDLIMQAVAVIGGAVGIYGRTVATKQIG